MALAPSATYDLRFTAEQTTETRTYLYGSRVGDQMTGGAWGLFQIDPAPVILFNPNVSASTSGEAIFAPLGAGG